MLSLHIITFPQKLLGHILVKRNIRYWFNTSLFNFDTHKGLTVKNYIFFGVYTAAMGFTSDACWFLLLKSLLIKNNKKREAALKNEAGGDEKHVFFHLALSTEANEWQTHLSTFIFMFRINAINIYSYSYDTRQCWKKFIFLAIYLSDLTRTKQLPDIWSLSLLSIFAQWYSWSWSGLR